MHRPARGGDAFSCAPCGDVDTSDALRWRAWGCGERCEDAPRGAEALHDRILAELRRAELRAFDRACRLDKLQAWLARQRSGGGGGGCCVVTHTHPSVRDPVVQRVLAAADVDAEACVTPATDIDAILAGGRPLFPQQRPAAAPATLVVLDPLLRRDVPVVITGFDAAAAGIGDLDLRDTWVAASPNVDYNRALGGWALIGSAAGGHGSTPRQKYTFTIDLSRTRDGTPVPAAAGGLPLTQFSFTRRVREDRMGWRLAACVVKSVDGTDQGGVWVQVHPRGGGAASAAAPADVAHTRDSRVAGTKQLWDPPAEGAPPPRVLRLRLELTDVSAVTPAAYRTRLRRLLARLYQHGSHDISAAARPPPQPTAAQPSPEHAAASLRRRPSVAQALSGGGAPLASVSMSHRAHLPTLLHADGVIHVPPSAVGVGRDGCTGDAADGGSDDGASCESDASGSTATDASMATGTDGDASVVSPSLPSRPSESEGREVSWEPGVRGFEEHGGRVWATAGRVARPPSVVYITEEAQVPAHLGRSAIAARGVPILTVAPFCERLMAATVVLELLASGRLPFIPAGLLAAAAAHLREGFCEYDFVRGVILRAADAFTARCLPAFALTLCSAVHAQPFSSYRLVRAGTAVAIDATAGAPLHHIERARSATGTSDASAADLAHLSVIAETSLAAAFVLRVMEGAGYTPAVEADTKLALLEWLVQSAPLHSSGGDPAADIPEVFAHSASGGTVGDFFETRGRAPAALTPGSVRLCRVDAPRTRVTLVYREEVCADDGGAGTTAKGDTHDSVWNSRKRGRPVGRTRSGSGGSVRKRRKVGPRGHVRGEAEATGPALAGVRLSRLVEAVRTEFADVDFVVAGSGEGGALGGSEGCACGVCLRGAEAEDYPPSSEEVDVYVQARGVTHTCRVPLELATPRELSAALCACLYNQRASRDTPPQWTLQRCYAADAMRMGETTPRARWARCCRGIVREQHWHPTTDLFLFSLLTLRAHVRMSSGAGWPARLSLYPCPAQQLQPTPVRIALHLYGVRRPPAHALRGVLHDPPPRQHTVDDLKFCRANLAYVLRLLTTEAMLVSNGTPVCFSRHHFADLYHCIAVLCAAEERGSVRPFAVPSLDYLLARLRRAARAAGGTSTWRVFYTLRSHEILASPGEALLIVRQVRGDTGPSAGGALAV